MTTTTNVAVAQLMASAMPSSSSFSSSTPAGPAPASTTATPVNQPTKEATEAAQKPIPKPAARRKKAASPSRKHPKNGVAAPSSATVPSQQQLPESIPDRGRTKSLGDLGASTAPQVPNQQEQPPVKQASATKKKRKQNDIPASISSTKAGDEAALLTQLMSGTLPVAKQTNGTPPSQQTSNKKAATATTTTGSAVSTNGKKKFSPDNTSSKKRPTLPAGIKSVPDMRPTNKTKENKDDGFFSDSAHPPASKQTPNKRKAHDSQPRRPSQPTSFPQTTPGLPTNYAGPSFHNSPDARSLPVPFFHANSGGSHHSFTNGVQPQATSDGQPSAGIPTGRRRSDQAPALFDSPPSVSSPLHSRPTSAVMPASSAFPAGQPPMSSQQTYDVRQSQHHHQQQQQHQILTPLSSNPPLMGHHADAPGAFPTRRSSLLPSFMPAPPVFAQWPPPAPFDLPQMHADDGGVMAAPPSISTSDPFGPVAMNQHSTTPQRLHAPPHLVTQPPSGTHRMPSLGPDAIPTVPASAFLQAQATIDPSRLRSPPVTARPPSHTPLTTTAPNSAPPIIHQDQPVHQQQQQLHHISESLKSLLSIGKPT